MQPQKYINHKLIFSQIKINHLVIILFGYTYSINYFFSKKENAPLVKEELEKIMNQIFQYFGTYFDVNKLMAKLSVRPLM